MRGITGVVIALLLTTSTQAQLPADKAATDAFVITRMADKFHLQPKPIDKTFSVHTFDQLLKTLDNERIFFTQEDLKQLLPFRNNLDEEVLGRKTAFLQLLSALYEKRLRMADTMIEHLSRQPFEFNTVEKITVAEDTSFAANTAAQRNKIRKLLKSNVLELLLQENDPSRLNVAQQKKYIDSLEVIYRKKVQSTLRRFIRKDLESPGGIPQMVGEAYCEVIASYYDPHTAYFSLTAKENFVGDLGQKAMVFGFGLDEDDGGSVIISRLKPGSPAFKSGQLNEGDKILSIKWSGKSAIDVADASLDEVSAIIESSNHEKAMFTVQKADGTRREVELAKAEMENDDDGNRVKSFVLKGAKNIGYISLPAFYSDWENDDNVKGCANDVAKEILKLKKEKIDALIIDLRYNGGGSVEEAVDLSGIFIDAGPVAMQKDRNSKVFTHKDGSRGTMWDGPLFVMVNGFSASASELVAGTLQDYNRAIIVGSTTYGKATSQVILPMDTTINFQSDLSKKQTSSYIKITLDKLYRITGTTAQFSGVQPDVKLPDIIDAAAYREQNKPFAIPATGIEANKFFKPLPPLNKIGLQQLADNIVDTAAFFKTLTKFMQQKKASAVKTDTPLSWKEALQTKQNAFNADDVPSYNVNLARFFTAANNQYEQQRIQANKQLKETSDAWIQFLEKDPYLQVMYQLATQYINKP